MTSRYVGIDVGAEAIKLVELAREADGLRWTRREVADHHKDPAAALTALLASWDWPSVAGAAVTGRLARAVALQRVPFKQAQADGCRFLHGPGPATVVTIGSHGFSVLELRAGGVEVLRENSRCAQGTGNFLRQLVERFDLTVEEAAELAAGVEQPAHLSGRCPVILKTDMTHLANKGEGKDRILAGLLDAIAENVEVLVKPRLCPDRILLAGGVARAARIRSHFRRFAERHGLTVVDLPGDDFLFLEALGAARAASEHGLRVPPLHALLERQPAHGLERIAPLSAALPRVRRVPRAEARAWEGPRDVVLGFDIGSTGSKAVALDLEWKEPLWEGYLSTNGDPVGAAQALARRFLEGPAALHRVRGLGATGSGREIVGSLLSVCYGPESVYVLNEIAAHAEGALRLDPRVDTIFEIGGQDAKYIRLSEGRVVDAAMNEACSAGTGSFIEEQGKRFSGMEHVAQLGAEALAAAEGVALGQHCSIFMAEIIDEAVAAGARREAILAGLHDSVVANYLNRVKGTRSVGQVIFCQGMPFSSDALAAAVAQQTGAEVVVPPTPGLMGAIGIALLAARDLAPAPRPLEVRRFLAARVERKDQFTCGATQGCGAPGNRCRVDRLTTLVEGERQRFTWGGACALYDQGTRRAKLPDLAPDPFRERAALVQAVIDEVSVRRGGKLVALTDEFQLKGLFPFFATFIHRLGFDLTVATGADREALRRGIEAANVPFCAPMQQFHGVVAAMADRRPDLLFVPMLRELPRVKEERFSTVCPIVQAAPDVLRWDLVGAPRIVSPVIDMGQGFLESEEFRQACRALAADLGGPGSWEDAWRAARAAQVAFEGALLDAGRRALSFCEERGVTPVVVLGRSYTIHNDVLNSNVPSILREQGAIAVPVDCLPVPEEAPVFPDVFWGYSQRVLRAAWAVRRRPGVYSVFCSNYSCGPDSFTAHSYSWLMEGKPFAIIETDGHAGDAGTKTRIEAFLHCVREDRRAASPTPPVEEGRLAVRRQEIQDLIRTGGKLLVPYMGPETEMVAAAFRGAGLAAEVLPPPTRDTLRIGRRHTSGKECLPVTVTVGGLLERLERERGGTEPITWLMPGSCGPCRFGAYRDLHHQVLQRTGWGERVRIWSPPFDDYFAGLPAGLKAVVFAGLAAVAALEEALHDVRPVETREGEAGRIHGEAYRELAALIERVAAQDLSTSRILWEVAGGNAWGMPALLRRAAERLAAVKGKRELPSVLLVGEFFVRSEPFSNDFVARSLEQRGLRVRLEPSVEFLQFADYVNHKNGTKRGLASALEHWVRNRLVALCHHAAGDVLGWPGHATMRDVFDAGAAYVREELEVETPLTIGGSVEAWRRRRVDAVISVGPLECMPNKVAEAQLFHVAEQEGLHSLSLSCNGDPLDPEVIDNFAFEVTQRWRKGGAVPAVAATEEAAPAAATLEPT
jgi:predicted CoA-substrate-specific enzyme activase